MKDNQKVFRILMDQGITINPYKEDNIIKGYELNTYTDNGVNEIIFIDLKDFERPINGAQFVEIYNKTIKEIDIDERIDLNRMGSIDYLNTFSLEDSIKDFKAWHTKLLNMFSDKSPQQRQFEQVTDKLRSQVAECNDIIKLMPVKGNSITGCKRAHLQNLISNLDFAINTIDLYDFTPNEYSGDFKLSYS